MADITINISTRELLIQYAEKYETADFINGDPSWFMHQVSGAKNQEAMAFIACTRVTLCIVSCLPISNCLMNMARWATMCVARLTIH